MAGGKGGSSEVEIPDWMAGPAARNLGRAEQAQQIGYMPYSGPDVAAFTPAQEQSFQNNLNAASAFGLAPQGSQYQPMVTPQEFEGGYRGYSAKPLYDQSVANFKEENPSGAAIYDSMFGDVNAGVYTGGGGGDDRSRGQRFDDWHGDQAKSIWSTSDPGTSLIKSVFGW